MALTVSHCASILVAVSNPVLDMYRPAFICYCYYVYMDIL
jgi:hypothetical protein